MKCEVKRYLVPWWRPNEWMLWYRKIVDEVKDETAFILDLDDETIKQLEAIKSENVRELHDILNNELYKQTKISLWELKN